MFFELFERPFGSVRRVVQQNGTYSSVNNYDAYGCIINSTESVEMPYGFTEQEYDDYKALHNFRARFYDSELGIFYAVDPAGQGFAQYAYCGNNPVICVDRDGKNPILAAIGVAFVVGGVIDVIQNAIAGKYKNGNWPTAIGDFLIGGAKAATATMGCILVGGPI
ncbi:MAG: RHS repeat-associated core domain-containing protein [bacterium]